MKTKLNAFRLPVDLDRALEEAAQPPYSKIYLVTEALRAYKPIRKHLEIDTSISDTEPKQASMLPAAPKKKKANGNRPGSLAEVGDYFWNSGLFVNQNTCQAAAQKFWDHFEEADWCAGKFDKPIKNWKLKAKNTFLDGDMERKYGHGSIQGNSQSNNGHSQPGRGQTPLQHAIDDHAAGMAYAATLRDN